MEEKEIELGFVYIIKHKTNITLKYYVGSTLNPHKRWLYHKGDCYNMKSVQYNKPLYKYIRKNGGIDIFEMVVIYENKPDYKWFEASYIKSTWYYNLNNKIPWRTPEEKILRKLERDKKRYHLNHETINKNRLVKIECKFCGSFVRRDGMVEHQKSAKCKAAQNN